MNFDLIEPMLRGDSSAGVTLLGTYIVAALIATAAYYFWWYGTDAKGQLAYGRLNHPYWPLTVMGWMMKRLVRILIGCVALALWTFCIAVAASMVAVQEYPIMARTFLTGTTTTFGTDKVNVGAIYILGVCVGALTYCATLAMYFEAIPFCNQKIEQLRQFMGVRSRV